MSEPANDAIPARFRLGLTCMTPGAATALCRNSRSAAGYLLRHVRGDWASMAPEDQLANQAAVYTGGRILSAYTLPDRTRLWVITEADRSVTTLLLPGEY